LNSKTTALDAETVGQAMLVAWFERALKAKQNSKDGFFFLSFCSNVINNSVVTLPSLSYWALSFFY